MAKKLAKKKKEEPGDDDYVTDPGAESDVEEADVDDTKNPAKAGEDKPKVFSNF